MAPTTNTTNSITTNNTDTPLYTNFTSPTNYTLLTVGSDSPPSSNVFGVATNRYRVSVDHTRAYLLDLSNNTSDNLLFSFYQISTNAGNEVKTREDVAVGGTTNFTNVFDDISGGQSYVLVPLVTGVYQLELSSMNNVTMENYALYLSEHTGSNVGRVIYSVDNGSGTYTPSHYPPTNYTLGGQGLRWDERVCFKQRTPISLESRPNR